MSASAATTAAGKGTPGCASPVSSTLDFCMEWNAENQLKRVTKNGLEQARFSYDPNGRRVEKVAGGVTTSYLYDGGDILREIRGAATLKYIHGPGIDEPLAREEGAGTLTYYHADGLGSVVKRTSQAGAVVHEYRYDAWGNIEAGGTEPGYAFTSREWDPEVGLEYYRARYFDPKIGRFLSEDPARADINLYAYANGRPTNLTDPSGARAGDPFASPADAAIDAFKEYLCESVRKDREYCFRLYKNADGTYSWTGPKVGGQHSCSVPVVPKGNTNAGYAHTHGAESGPKYRDEEFGQKDKDLAMSEGGFNAYLATPSGRILEYDPVVDALGEKNPIREIGRIELCGCS